MHAGPSSTTEHRTKRKCQPSIAIYFSPAHGLEGANNANRVHGSDTTTTTTTTTAAAIAAAHTQRASLVSILPTSVQADLLTVGMRVRKSVCEGYKVHKSSAHATPTRTPMSRSDTEAESPRESGLDGRQRELLPFCGLHKIGDFAEQPTTNIHLYGALDASGSPLANPFPLLAESFTQPFSSRPLPNSIVMHPEPSLLTSSKRSWQGEDEVSLHPGLFFTIPISGTDVGFEDVPVSPLTETPTTMLPVTRQLAQPKSRRLAQQPLPDNAGMDMEFDNPAQIEEQVTVGRGGDFEEADFLGKEVDMEG